MNKDNTPTPGGICGTTCNCEAGCEIKANEQLLNEAFKPTPGQSIKTAEANKNYCTLTNEELAISARQWLERLIQTGGRDWCLPVPANPNKDVDLILAEIIHRFSKLNHSPTEAEINEAAESVKAHVIEDRKSNVDLTVVFKLAVQWLQNYQQQQPNPAIAVIEAKITEMENSIVLGSDCNCSECVATNYSIGILETIIKQIKG